MTEENLVKLKELITKLDPDNEIFTKVNETLEDYSEEYADSEK